MTDREEVITAPRTPAADTLDVGRQLRRAREAKNLVLADIAKELRIDARFLEAIEQDKHQQLSSPVFVKGYVRSYARVLGLDPEPLVRALDQAGLAAAPPIVAVGRRGGESVLPKIAWARVIGTVLAIAGIVLAGLVVRSLYSAFEHGAPAPGLSAEAEPPAELNALPLPPPAEGEAAQLLPLPDPSTFSGVPDAPVPAESGAEAPESAAAETAPPAAAEARAPGTLVLEFAQDSWVEVYDARERRLLGRVGKAGQKETLTGTPPLNVVLGYAPGVKVAYNGAPVDTKKYSRGQVARFTVGAEGE